MSSHAGPSVFAATAAQPLSSLAALASDDVQRSFHEASVQAEEKLRSIDVRVPDNLLRSDIFDVLARVLGRQLTGAELGAVTKCFACDTSAVISWQEFSRSFQVLQQLSAAGAAAAPPHGRGAVAAAAAARRHKGAGPAPQLLFNKPLTSSQDIGWCVGVVPVQPRPQQHFPSRTTDVTRGEGSSTATYFGMHM